MPNPTSDEIYKAAQQYVSEREAYDRSVARWGKHDPQAVAALIRLGTALSRLRLAMTGFTLDRAGNE